MFWSRLSSRAENDHVLPVDRPMEKAAAYMVSAGIVAFGIWILIAGLSSGVPALWTCVALIPIVIGLVSAFGDC
jgi:hypothetical protein